MIRKSNKQKELRWRDALRRQASSGLSIRKFCVNEGISQPSFYAWRRKIRERDGSGTRSGKSCLGNGGAFIPLKLIDSAGTMEILHSHGCQVRITGEINTVALKQVLDVLDERGRA